MSRIYLSPPDVGEHERKLLLEAFDSNWIAPVGPDLDAFEQEVADRVGVAAAVALSSGTAALHLALLEVGVGPGDDVLVPALTFVATANAVRYLGANPVIVDADTSWQIDVSLVESELARRAAAGRRPAAVVSVDLYGRTPDYERLETACRTYDVPLVEDAAEALGAERAGRAAGSFGRVGVFSFNGNKIVTTGGGGMLVSNDEPLIAHARHLSTQAREPVVHYEHEETGFNYRLSNLLAAVGRAQLRRLDEMIARRRAIETRYRAALSPVPGITFMPESADEFANHWLTCILVDQTATGVDRDGLRLALEARDIESRPTWKPLQLQPVLRDAEFVGGDVSAGIFRDGLCLPSGSGLTDTDLERVVGALLDAVGTHAR